MVEVAICEQRSDEGSFDCRGPAKIAETQAISDQPAQQRCAGNHKNNSKNSGDTLCVLRCIWIVERPFEATDNLSDDCDGMRYAPIYPIGITDDRIQQEREHQNKIRLQAARNDIEIRGEHAQILRASVRCVNKNHLRHDEPQTTRTK